MEKTEKPSRGWGMTRLGRKSTQIFADKTPQNNLMFWF
jgi:hypothetical protein